MKIRALLPSLLLSLTTALPHPQNGPERPCAIYGSPTSVPINGTLTFCRGNIAPPLFGGTEKQAVLGMARSFCKNHCTLTPNTTLHSSFPSGTFTVEDASMRRLDMDKCFSGFEKVVAGCGDPGLTYMMGGTFLSEEGIAYDFRSSG